MKDGFIKISSVTPDIEVANTEKNTENIIEKIKEAIRNKVKILVFPELSVTSASLFDLQRNKKVLEKTEKAIKTILVSTENSELICFVSAPFVIKGALFDCAFVMQDGKILGIVPKTNNLNYGQYFENRYFSNVDNTTGKVMIFGKEVPFGNKIIFASKEVPELTIGCTLGEDAFMPRPKAEELALSGANVIVNMAASPEIAGKKEERNKVISVLSSRLSVTYIYTNASCGESTNDSVYAGHSLIYENGKLLKESTLFENCTLTTEIDVQKAQNGKLERNYYNLNDTEYIYFDQKIEETELTREIPKSEFIPENKDEIKNKCSFIISAQANGLKRRLEHINCRTAVIGISGGLDSTLALIVMVKAFDLMKKPRKNIIAVTMPCFGTSGRTKNNARRMCEILGVELREINISESVLAHFKDIGQNPEKTDITFENSQARERTQVLMDLANKEGGIVVGTGDLSELALGFATYNGDQMSMYGVNATVPKTLMRYIVLEYADECGNKELCDILKDVVKTPVSPELIPLKNGEISQVTEDIVGPYELHDFFLYHIVKNGFSPGKVKRMAVYAFKGLYTEETVAKWLNVFLKRFVTQQFKRSCLPDGPKVDEISLSQRAGFKMVSDISNEIWK